MKWIYFMFGKVLEIKKRSRKPRHKRNFKVRIVHFGTFNLKYILCLCGEEIIAYDSVEEHVCEKCESRYLNQDVQTKGML